MRVTYSSGWKCSIKTFSASFSWNNDIVLNIDASGRFLSVIFDKITFKHGLDTSWMAISRQSLNHERIRRFLNQDDIKVLYSKIRSAVLQFEKMLETAEYRINLDSRDPFTKENYPSLIEKWKKALQIYNFEKEQKEKRLYESLYSQIGVLPPDRYGSLVLQITEGCVYNRCNFCTLYQGVKYKIKTPEEFYSHVKEIQRFLGESIGRFHSIFLGDANALAIPQDDLIQILNIIHQEFSLIRKKQVPNLIFKNRPQFAGIYSFLDNFTNLHKNLNDFKALADKDIRMVYLGIESGSPQILKLLNKPNDIKKVIALIKILKKAGINIGAIFLVGAGGENLADEQVQGTVKLLDKLKLTENDIIFLSKLSVSEDSLYSKNLITEGFKIMEMPDMDKQVQLIKQNILNSYKKNEIPPKIAKYGIRDFIY